MKTMRYCCFSLNSKGTGFNSAVSNEITFDPVFGNQSIDRGYKLGLPDNGGFLTGSAAVAKLELPIWGPQGNKTFKELLPIMPDPVDEYINSSEAHYPWNPFNEADPTTWPEGNPDNGRGWECEDDRYPGRLYQNVIWEGDPTAHEWGEEHLHVDRYRKQKLSYGEVVPVYNDQYPIVEAERAAKHAEYKQLIFDTFTMLGLAVFPVIRDNMNPTNLYNKLIANTLLQAKLKVSWTCKEDVIRDFRIATNRWDFEQMLHDYLYHWEEKTPEGIWMPVPVEEGKYAVATKYVEWIAGQNINHPQWKGFVDRTILNVETEGHWSGGIWVPAVPANKRVKLLCGVYN